jgi:hypothetical protein
MPSGEEATYKWVTVEGGKRLALRPGSAQFLAVLDEIRELHLKKTLDYGQDNDALSNIRSSAEVVNVPAWAGCMIRIADKMHRIKSFFRRGRVEFDGIEDTLLDIAAYAAIGLVLYRESVSQNPPDDGSGSTLAAEED